MKNNKSLNQLNSIAKKALSKNHDQYLLYDRIKTKIDFKQNFIHEKFVFCYKTDIYNELNNEQKLFLNHLTYYIHYFRTTGAELIAIYNNKSLINFLENDQIKKYIQLEITQEQDHIACFEYVMHEIA